MTIAAGIHELTFDLYHADPAERPSLTASVAKILCAKSPRHAWAAHPRLNPAFLREDESKFDVGTAAHQLLLEGVDSAYVIAADDWRTKATQEARDEARAAGRVPLLSKQYEAALAMVDAIWEQLARHDADPTPFTAGKPERTLVWEEDGVLCRARLDWLRDDLQACDDLKTTKASAHPNAWLRTALSMAAEVQARFYERGLRIVTGEDVPLRFVVVETAPPYALSVVNLAPSLAAIADAKIDLALRVWKRCLASGDWPGYARQVASLEAPPWSEVQWLEREALEDEVAA